MKTILLPGMGADSTMYPKNKYDKLKDVLFAEWPNYKGETTIYQVAWRVINEYNIKNDIVIGGASLGGMVAVEIAKIIKIKKVLLISSTTHPDTINPALRKLSTLAEIAPIKLVQLLAGTINHRLNSAVLTMFEKADTDFIRAMSKAVFEWKGIEGYQCETFRIHGKKDKVILPPEDPVELIENGRHLITMTHAEIVAEFIQKNTSKDS